MIKNEGLGVRENAEENVVLSRVQTYVQSLKSMWLFDLHLTCVIASFDTDLSLDFWNLVAGYLDIPSVQTKFWMRFLQQEPVWVLRMMCGKILSSLEFS